MRIKTTTSIDGVSKMAAFAAVSYPIFKYYGYGYANFSMLLMYIFFIYVLKTYIVWYIFMTLFITFSVEMWYNYLESSIY